MTVAERIDAYLQGWLSGDVSRLLAQAADSYFFDDPNVGRIPRADFEAYMAGVKADVERIRDGRSYENLEDLSEIAVNEEDDGTATVWFWWVIVGTPVEGSSLVKVGPDGVRSEIICYYARAATGIAE